MTIHKIAQELLDLSSKLEAGALSADEIMTMTELSRQLHERLIVLQYKAFEQQVQLDAHEGRATEAHEPPAREVTAAAEPETEALEAPAAPAAEPEPMPEAPEEEDVAEGPAFRISEPEVSPNQISLIDSIEEIKRMEQSINETFKGADGPSLAQKLNHKPLADLRKGIGINQRFQFVSILFDNDAEAFDNAISKLNEATSYIEADEYVQNSLKNRYDWQMKNPVVKELVHLIERRFL